MTTRAQVIHNHSAHVVVQKSRRLVATAYEIHTNDKERLVEFYMIFEYILTTHRTLVGIILGSIKYKTNFPKRGQDAGVATAYYRMAKFRSQGNLCKAHVQSCQILVWLESVRKPVVLQVVVMDSLLFVRVTRGE